MNQPLISFIITYHNEPFPMLRECLESVLSLTLTAEEREIILIDDGSDVSPLNEISDYWDSLLYVRQKCQGLSVARNMGIDICKGKYIQFIDADDKLLQAGYEHCLDIVRYKDADMVMFNFTTTNEDTDAPYLFDGPISGAGYMRQNNLKASACVYTFKKNNLLSLRFTPGRTSEDEEFTPQIVLRSERIFITDTCAYYYRQRENSISHPTDSRTKLKHLDDTEYVIKHLFELSDTMPSTERNALQRRVAQLTMDYIYNIIVYTHSEHQLNERLKRLETLGLFPLPDKSYTTKYRLFSKLTRHKTFRKLMILALHKVNI